MKTIYRIELKALGRNDMAEEAAKLACLYNGGSSMYDLSFIQAQCALKKSIYPSDYSDTTIEIIGENTLHIDRKIGDNYVTVLAINLVEVWETAKTLEDIDKEAAENVTLQRHLSQQGEQC